MKTQNHLICATGVRSSHPSAREIEKSIGNQESTMLKRLARSVAALACLGFCVQYATAAVINTGTGSTFLYQRDVAQNFDRNSIISEAVSTPWLAWHYGEGDPAVAYLGAPFAPLGDPSGIILQFHAPDGYLINSATITFTGRVADGGAAATDYVQSLWGTTARANWWDYFGSDTQFAKFSTPGYFSSTVDLATAGFSGNTQDLYLSFKELQQTAGVMHLFESPDSSTYSPGVIVTLGVSPIPEPATLGLLAVGGLALLRRRRA